MIILNSTPMQSCKICIMISMHNINIMISIPNINTTSLFSVFFSARAIFRR